MANFAVRLIHGPGWDPSRQIRNQDAWDEHAAFMDRLVDDGFVILGGPVGALAGTIIGAGAVTVHQMVSHPQATLEPGTTLMFTLTEPLNLVAAAPTGN